jgi:hypothetical protein
VSVEHFQHVGCRQARVHQHHRHLSGHLGKRTPNRHQRHLATLPNLVLDQHHGTVVARHRAVVLGRLIALLLEAHSQR